MVWGKIASLFLEYRKDGDFELDFYDLPVVEMSSCLMNVDWAMSLSFEYKPVAVYCLTSVDSMMS